MAANALINGVLIIVIVIVIVVIVVVKLYILFNDFFTHHYFGILPRSS